MLSSHPLGYLFNNFFLLRKLSKIYKCIIPSLTFAYLLGHFCIMHGFISLIQQPVLIKWHLALHLGHCNLHRLKRIWIVSSLLIMQCVIGTRMCGDTDRWRLHTVFSGPTCFYSSFFVSCATSNRRTGPTHFIYQNLLVKRTFKEKRILK